MTRKDYVNIAAAILATQTGIRNNVGSDPAVPYEIEREAQLRGVRRAAAHICDFLADDNPRFDPAQFLKACGYGATSWKSFEELDESYSS